MSPDLTSNLTAAAKARGEVGDEYVAGLLERAAAEITHLRGELDRLRAIEGRLRALVADAETGATGVMSRRYVIGKLHDVLGGGEQT